jgi:hypothetical protein
MIRKGFEAGPVGLGMLFVLLIIFQSPLQAKLLRGEVTSVKDDGSSFSFKRTKPLNPLVSEQFTVSVTPKTKFEKISSLKELAAGDEVVVDAAKKSESKIWEASSVRILKVQLYQESPAPAKKTS